VAVAEFGDAKQCGMDVLSTRKFLKQTFGEAALWALADKLAPTGYSAVVTEVILPDDWRPLHEYDSFLRAIEELFPNSARKLGRFQCQDQLKWWQRGFMRVLKPAWLIENTMSLWPRYCNVGRWDVRWPRPTQVSAIMREMPPVSAAYCLTIVGFFERFLEMCGCRDIRAIHTTCVGRGEPECRHDVSWK
jgi:hypothetical protein